MAQGKKSFIAYSDWKDVFDELPNEDAGALIKHIFAYVNDENPVSDNVLIRAVFANIKSTLERDLNKWNNQLQHRSDAGKKSAEIRKIKAYELQRNPTSVKTIERNPTDNVSVSVNVKKSIEERKQDFKKSLIPFISVSFDKFLMKDFFEYWSEHGENDKKMRFEKQVSFSVDRRLRTWKQKDFDFKNKGKL